MRIQIENFRRESSLTGRAIIRIGGLRYERTLIVRRPGNNYSFALCLDDGTDREYLAIDSMTRKRLDELFKKSGG